MLFENVEEINFLLSSEASSHGRLHAELGWRCMA